MTAVPNHAQLLEAMPDGMYVVDLNRTITFWNGAAERITGYDATTAVGRMCGDGLLNHVNESGESMCGHLCPLIDTMNDGVSRSARVFSHHRDGHVVPILVTSGALRDEAGRIVGAVETFRDDRQSREAESRLRITERLALTDALTGVGNRRMMDRRLSERLSAATEHERFALMVIDLDRFKAINDAYGHSWGDRALSVVARTLRAVVGDDGDVTRFGGDEFVIVTGTMSAERVSNLARDVKSGVNASWIEGRQSPLRVSASVGVTLSCVGDTADSMMRRADDAMLKAKRSGETAPLVVECPRQDSNLRPSD
ncbi:diguanylate cyclase [Demequina sp. TTPB684]|uniref:diguanylate cyclase domain-containing protein n=1 Tax=unclassified Demequina TaxID=2620311 RepID=UPI001CF289F2|nr:diguanylate cyclase [Demequina sp. TTPB684]